MFQRGCAKREKETAVTTSVDVDKHIGESIATLVRESSPLITHAQVHELQYGELRFAGDISYAQQWTPGTTFDTIDEIEENNRTPNPQTAHIERNETVMNSYTWATEEAISLGMSVSASFKVPFVGGIDTSISTDYSFTSTETVTETKERGWKFIQDVLVPPHSKLTAVLKIEKTIPRVPFEMTGAFTGHMITDVSIWMGPLQSMLHAVRYPITTIFERRPLPNARVEGNTVYLTLKGVFTAAEGMKAIIDLTEVPLGGLDQAPKHWIVDVTPEHEIHVPQLPAEAK
ncbi:hypothetical protein EPA93_16830 [Ktedonosporobacter rubrisoli]|uniref:Uncharacterized protein n=1 Tax=Ktedonosporobacter rubrisoli TaxID=2509675 RepID=A0A4P6JQG0_KTERU|nr:hypothetical protein EPA93_16830 [Ktedonosporobacter rubrisoli]